MAKMGTGIDNSKWTAEPLGKTPREVLEKAKKSYISALKNSGLTIDEMMERFLKYRRAHDNSKKTYEYYVGIIKKIKKFIEENYEPVFEEAIEETKKLIKINVKDEYIKKLKSIAKQQKYKDVEIEDLISSVSEEELENVANEAIEQIDLSAASVNVGIDFFEDFSEWLRDGQERMLADASIANYQRGCKAFLYWCMERKYIPEFKIKIDTVQETIKDLYTKDELSILLAPMSKSEKAKFPDYRNWVIVNFILATGCRAASLSALNINDINWDNNTVRINKTKNKQGIIMKLVTPMVIILKEYLEIWNFERFPSDFPLFPSDNMIRLDSHNMSKAIARYNKKRGIEKTSIHLYRYAFAIGYLQKGGKLHRLKEIMGHKNINVTMKYARLAGLEEVDNADDYIPLNDFVSPPGRKMGTGIKK